MRRFWAFGIIFMVVLSVQTGVCQKISWTQYFYVARNIFPQAEQINVLLPSEEGETQKAALARAGANFRFKVKLFLFDDALSLGHNLKMMETGSILIVPTTPLLQEKSSMLYILSQAKDRNISVVSASQNYVDAGALVGLVKENGRLRVVVNLKFSPQLVGKFTPEFNRKIGIIKVMQ